MIFNQEIPVDAFHAVLHIRHSVPEAVQFPVRHTFPVVAYNDGQHVVLYLEFQFGLCGPGMFDDVMQRLFHGKEYIPAVLGADRLLG